MEFKIRTVKQKVAFAVILLVLVISCVAYSVYVPRLQELKNLQADLKTAEQAHVKLSALPMPAAKTDAEKKTLEEEVPAALDQSRFIEQLQDTEAKSGVVIQSLTFSEIKDKSTPGAGSAAGNKAAQSTPSAKTAAGTPVPGANGAPVLHELKEVDGNLSFEGDYSQIREFFRQMATSPRLITYKSWTISAKEVPLVSSSTPSKARSVNVQTQTVQTNNQADQRQVQQRQTEQRQTTQDLPANLPESTLPDDVLTDPLLKDRSPVYKEDEFNRVLGSIKQKSDLSHTQHDLDMANLEIQQTFNRYMAGLLGQSKAETILNQDYAGHFLQGANTNIRQVLGLAPLYTPSTSPLSLVLNQAALASPSPVSLPTPIPAPDPDPAPVQTKTIVTVNAQFAIYYAPDAANILPNPDPLHTYDPDERSNPVETR